MVKSNKVTTLAGDHVVTAALAALANGTSDETVVWTNNTGRTVKITQAGYVPDSDITGDDTNNLALQFRNKEADGDGTVGITTVKTFASGINANDFVEDVQTLSSTAADLLVDDGETVSLDKTENGSGLILPAGIAVLNFEYQ